MNGYDMARKKTVTTTRKHRPDFVLRFLDSEHRELVEKAARDQGLSINAWIVQTTLAAARRQIIAAKA